MFWLEVYIWTFFVLCTGTSSKQITGCEHKPCQNGGTCENHNGRFQCVCSQQSQSGRLYGGDNCSVVLSGCDDSACENGGICSPQFIDNRHSFSCFCPGGFTGQKCQIQTIFSFESKGHISIQASELQILNNVTFSFKTDRMVGTLLHHREDGFFISIALLDGYLCLFNKSYKEPNTLVQRLPDYLSDNNWHRVKASFRGSFSLIQLLCSGPNCSEGSHSELLQIEQASALSQPQTLFRSHSLTIGAVSDSWMSNNESHLSTYFLGCFRDVFVNSKLLVPTSAINGFQTNVTLGCSDEDKCFENPCQNRGHCRSQRWRSYTCECYRPYEGTHCEQEYIAARFGNKEEQSFAIFSLDEDLGNTLSVSMFVRTRQPSGLLLILANSTSQYLRVWLDDGRVHVQINNFETIMSHSDINDGHFYLLTVKLAETIATLFVAAQNQGSTAIRNTQVNSGDAIYVGGLTNSKASASFGGYFKGCIQDLRINTRRLQFYSLPALAESYNLQLLNNVEQGCSSYNSCAVNPCLNDGVCYPMWDDFICTCPPNTAGRHCEVVKWCDMSPCPALAVCIPHSQGFDCISNVTFQTVNSPLHYRSNRNIKRSINNVTLSFRTRQSVATLLHSQKGFDSLTVSLVHCQLTVQLVQVGQNISLVYNMGQVCDGLWHTVILRMETSTPQMWRLTVDAIIMPEEFRISSHALDFLREDADIFLGGVNATDVVVTGCLGPVEIGGLLLPYYMDSDLNFPRPQAEQFVRAEGNDVDLQYGCWGAKVCEPNPCENNGVCHDVFNLHQCTCSSEWTGLLCQEPTDKCYSSPCLFGNCTSLSREYKCDCELGYEGESCELEVDLCENNNCSNGATCLRGLERYACLCPQNVTGQYCDEKLPEIPWYIELKSLPQLPVSTCIGTRWNFSCFNGGNCSKENTCLCLPGFTGQWCEKDVDECASEPCMHGGFCANYHNSFECLCDVNYSGIHCQIDISDFYFYMFLGLWQNLFQLLSYLIMRIDDGPEIDWVFQND